MSTRPYYAPNRLRGYDPSPILVPSIHQSASVYIMSLPTQVSRQPQPTLVNHRVVKKSASTAQQKQEYAVRPPRHLKVSAAPILQLQPISSSADDDETVSQTQILSSVQSTTSNNREEEDALEEKKLGKGHNDQVIVAATITTEPISFCPTLTEQPEQNIQSVNTAESESMSEQSIATSSSDVPNLSSSRALKFFQAYRNVVDNASDSKPPPPKS